jgi:non-specific serine/threonine protein kinase
VGGCTLEALETICADGLAGSLIDLLSSLVESNLVIPVEKADGEVHFLMLDTIKNYGFGRLNSRPDSENTKRKHAAYYADLAELSLTEIRGHRNVYWFRRLAEEVQNFRSALSWSLSGDEPDLGIRMVGPLSYYWYYNGLIRENSRWVDIALEKSMRAAPSLRAKVLLTAGIVAYNLNELEKSQGFLTQALNLYRDLGDEIFEGFVLVHLAMASRKTSQKPEQILSMAIEASEIFRKHDSKSYMAMAFDVLGEITRSQGDFSASKKHFLDTLSLSKETGEILREATSQANLGILAFHQEEFDDAYEWNKMGLSLSAEIEAPYRKAYHLALLAGPIAALGHPGRAARILGAATTELDKLGFDQEALEQTYVVRYTNVAQELLATKSFHDAWQEGGQMMIDEAVGYALQDLS